MNITSGTSFLLMLFCVTKPYYCLADTCSVRNTFLQTCPKLDIGEYAKSTTRNIMFEQQSVERESRMVNVRERVGTERLVNNRRIVDSDSRISNFPARSAKAANNEPTEQITNRDFRRSTMNDRIATRHRVVNENLKEFRVRDSERAVYNRKYLTRESRLQKDGTLTTRNQNFPKEQTAGIRIALSNNNRRTSQRIPRESAIDRELHVVDIREPVEIRLKNRDRNAPTTIRKFDIIRDSRELPIEIGSAERSRHHRTIDRTILLTSSPETRNLKSLTYEVRKTVNGISLTYNIHRSPTRNIKTTSNNGLRQSLNDRMARNVQILEKRTAATRDLRLPNSHQPRTRGFQLIDGGRTMLTDNRETRDRHSFDFQLQELERRASRYSADNRRFADRNYRFYEHFAGSSRVLKENGERLSDFEKVRKLEERSLTGEVEFTERESRNRQHIRSKSDARTFEVKLNNDVRTSAAEAVRKLEERTSRRYRSDAFLERDSRIHRQFSDRSNTRALKEKSDTREQTYEDVTRRVSNDPKILERRTLITNRKSTEPSLNLRTSRNLPTSNNNYRIGDRRTIGRNLQNVDSRAERVSNNGRISNIRYSVSNNYLSTKDENNNERIQVNDRHSNTNNYYDMMVKSTTTWSNIVTTTLSVLLFAHMIGSSSDLKKYQYLTSYFNAVKEKVL